MKILVAGIGNVFFGDDGFGPAVAEHLRTRTWPAQVDVIDFGIRGMDLAFALTSGIDAAILLDTVERGGVPGTMYMIEPIASAHPPELAAHVLDPARVLALAASLGTPPRVVRLIGCEPARLTGDDDEPFGLSDPVARAVETAAVMVDALVERLREEAACTN